MGLLIDFTHKAVVNIDGLFLLAVLANDFLMHHDLLNQGIEHFGGQFLRMRVLLNETDPLVDVHDSLMLRGKLGLQTLNLFQHLRLFCLVFFRQNLEIVLRDAFCCPVLIELGKQPVQLLLPLLHPFQLCIPHFYHALLFAVVGMEQLPFQVFFSHVGLRRPVLQTT